MSSSKTPISSYTILFFITIFVGLLSYVVPSGTFYYQDPKTHKIIKDDHLSQEQIKTENLTPVLSTFHTITKKTASVNDILTAPIVGAIKIIEFFILILVLGIFLEMIKSLKVFEIFIYLIVKYKLNYKLTTFLSFFVISLLSSVTGLRDENIVFLALLTPLFSYFGFSLLASGLIVLFSAVVGITSSALNPTIVGIFSSLSGLPISTGFWIRLLLYIILLVVGFGILLKVLPDTGEPTLTHEIPENHIRIRFREGFSALMLLTAFGTFIYCLLKNFSLIQTQGYLLGLTILSGMIGGLKETQLISTIKKGTQELLPIAINIAVARGILHILEITRIKDTFLYGGSQLLGTDLSIFVFSLFFILIIFLFYLLINSTSAVSSLIFPLLYPLVIPHHVSYSIFVLWFLIATGFSQIFNPSGFLLTQIRTETGLSYLRWVKIVYPIPLVLVVIWLISIIFV